MTLTVSLGERPVQGTRTYDPGTRKSHWERMHSWTLDNILPISWLIDVSSELTFRPSQ